ncbi:MAG: prevent-host-death protein [Campylobacterota bacterium]|nr:prevent-host-death protein [Campylobacterota bacterium]
MTISANEVKIKGVSVFDAMFEKFNEVVINVRGKNKYCVIPFEEYEEYRAYKLDMAHKEVMKNIDQGKYHTDTNRHFDTIKKAIGDV